jgi:predicted aldo/keto reductase-like oxidoreductase
MEPVKGGTLSALPEEAEAIFRRLRPEDEPSRWALRFVQSLPGVEVCLSGMNASAQILQNMEDMPPMTEEELDACRQVAEILTSSTAIPCTGCNYCIHSCPKGIPIPEYFKMYNEYHRYPKDDWKIKPSYAAMVQRGLGKASDCIACGRCEKMCPQNIEISNFLVKVKEALEQ